MTTETKNRVAFKMSIFEAARDQLPEATNGRLPEATKARLPEAARDRLPEAGRDQLPEVLRSKLAFLSPRRWFPVWQADDSGEIDDSGRGAIIGGMFVFLMFFGAFGIWAVTAPLKGATTANGQIVVEGSRSAVQHIEGGTVRAVLVKEGDRVTAGQLLMQLDDNMARTNVMVLAQQFDSLRAQAARLTAELQQADAITFPADLVERSSSPEVLAAIQGQNQLFAARKSILASQIAALEKRIDELVEQMRGARAQGRSRSEQRKSFEDELRSIRELVETGVITRSRQVDLERNLQRIRGEEEDISAKVALDQHSVEQIRQQLLQTKSERIGQTAAELRDVQNRIADVQQRLVAARDILAHTEIRAPVSGIVLAPTTHTPDSVIARGEKVMEIVPEEREMLVEAAIRVEDIAYVHPGMRAEVKLTAFKQRNMAIIDGKIDNVSADRITDSRTGVSHYTIRVRLVEGALKDLPNVSLYPGMPVTVYVPTGERTAFDYLMAPLTDSISSAFREP